MVKQARSIAKIVAGMVIILAIIQIIWPRVYPSIVRLNPYPTNEYLQIMWLLSPMGLSIVTIVLGLILIAWIAFVYR